MSKHSKKQHETKGFHVHHGIENFKMKHGEKKEQKTPLWRKIKRKLSFLKYIDPFYYVDAFVLPKINPQKNELVEWIVYALTAFVSAFILYTLLGLLFGTSSPMVIVYSGSMEPAFYRGDIIALKKLPAENLGIPIIETTLLTLKEIPFSSFATPLYSREGGSIQLNRINFQNGGFVDLKKEGPVVVYFSQYLQKPIIHRAIIQLNAKDGTYFLTKGDSVNNNTIDEDCGKIIYNLPEKTCLNLYPVAYSEIQGTAFFKIPLLGYIKLFFFDDIPNFLFGKVKA